MTHLLLALLLACGQAPTTTPEAAPSAEAPKPPVVPSEHSDARPSLDVDDSCEMVFTGDDATAIYQACAGLKVEGEGVCAFSDIDAKGSKISIVYKKTDGTKVPVQLEPSACVEKPLEGAVVNAPYVLSVPPNSKKQCPKALEALAAAVKAGSLPPPTER